MVNKDVYIYIDGSDVTRKFTLGRLKPLPFPFLPLPSLPSSPSLASPPHPSEVGPPNPARGSGSAVSSPSGVWGEAPAEIEFGAF